MTSIYCIGRNYAEHALELKNAVPTAPIVFLKSEAALRALESGPLAHASETFHHEAELVVRIARAAPLGGQGSWDLIDEVALGLDLTRREVQNDLKAKGLPWTAAKSFAGAALLGPFVSKHEFKDLQAIRLTFEIDGNLKQDGVTSHMLFDVPTLLTHLLSAQALAVGDLIYTGTPSGVGPIRRGERFTLAFPEIGRRFPGQL